MSQCRPSIFPYRPGFLTRVTHRVSLLEQELFLLWSTCIDHWFLLGFMLLNFVVFCRQLFVVSVPFRLAIVLSDLLWFTVSMVTPLYCLIFFDLRFLWLPHWYLPTFLTMEAWHKMTHPFRKQVKFTEQYRPSLQDSFDITVRYCHNSLDFLEQEQQWN